MKWYFLYFAICLLGLDYLAFRYLINPIENKIPVNPGKTLVVPKGLSLDFVNNVGSIVTNRGNHFTHFKKEKSPGSIRIGVFGGSFIWGDQVKDGEDFPALLQKMLHAEGFGHVEVLNFGNPGYEFHQTYMTWDSYGRHYDLDMVLMGPEIFNFFKMHTFNFSYQQPEFLFARYVLSKKGIKLIQVKGRSIKERMSGYFSFIPSFDYLRYDYNSPFFIKALIGHERQLKNPFYYYTKGWISEKKEIYKIMLEEWHSSGIPIGYLDSEDRLGRISKSIASKVSSGVYQALDRFPYFHKQHHTFAGNQVMASLYLSLLLDREDIQILSPTASTQQQEMEKDEEVVQFKKGTSLFLDEVNLGKLVELLPVQESLATNFLLSIRARDESTFLDNIFVQLDKNPHKALYSVSNGDKKKLLNPKSINSTNSVFYSAGEVDIVWNPSEEDDGVKLFWGDIEIGSGNYSNGTFFLVSLKRPALKLEVVKNLDLLKYTDNKASGILYLGDTKNKREIGRWSKKKLKIEKWNRLENFTILRKKND
ncbi:MAG: hypothetical protein HN509_15185 [Halobacteriovoraceae bacterium]|jgi:hypothetical protein|nr:hypothetical protein [Halobacteriovoraceae bacterium]MBT5095805.1 hypothetical protein [Halobacteriovoraceae bacterium]